MAKECFYLLHVRFIYNVLFIIVECPMIVNVIYKIEYYRAFLVEDRDLLKIRHPNSDRYEIILYPMEFPNPIGNSPLTV